MIISHDEWMRLASEADAEMKRSNGHRYQIILKTRCTKCGRSPRQKGKCPGWVNTYTEILHEKVERYLTVNVYGDSKQDGARIGNPAEFMKSMRSLKP